MRTNAMWRRAAARIVRAAFLPACVALAAAASPAAAQLSGELRYVGGYDLVPNPPEAARPMTLVLYGTYPGNCGVLDEASVQDPEHVRIRLRALTACPDSSYSAWSAIFPLGALIGGNHTVAFDISIDRADSGLVSYHGSLTFGVVDSIPPEPMPTFVSLQTTDPWPPTPTAPMAFIVGGQAPFACPVVSDAAVVDSSHLALTLSPGSGCPGGSDSWSHRFELGIQREGHHFLELALTIAGDSAVTYHVPVHFLVVNDTTGWGPPPPSDSLANGLSASRPNPFAGESRFSVSLDQAGDAEVAVFDINGRRVNRVFQGRLSSGTTELSWNGRRDDGTPAPSGIYFYRLSIQGRVISRRLILMRK